MTCFWDGILYHLTTDDYKKFKFRKPSTARELCSYLKHHNRRTPSVMWNNESLMDKQMDENFEAISQHTFSNDGYDCSISDPFLFLVSELFKVNIVHDTCCSLIRYDCENSIRVLHFVSNKHHFWHSNGKQYNKKHKKNKKNKNYLNI